MNLHETLTNRHFIAHAVPVAFCKRQEHRGWARAPRQHPHGSSTPPFSLLIGIAVLFGVLLVPMGASAATCDSRDMVDAAANGRAISQHTPACYQQTLAGLPGDLDSYLPAVRANILQAMHRDATLDAPVSAPAQRRSTQSVASSAAVAPAVAVGVRGPVTSLLEGLGPAHVDEVPLPVVALGGGAALLLLAGLGTSLARVRSRRPAR